MLTIDNRVIYVPNSAVVSSKIYNYSKEPIRRIDRTFVLPIIAVRNWSNKRCWKPSQLTPESTARRNRLLRSPLI
jgi:hypothetical protein